MAYIKSSVACVVMFSRLVGRLKDHTKRIASFIMEPAGPSIGYNTDSKLISFHPIGCIFTCSSALPLSLCPSRRPLTIDTTHTPT